MLTERMELTVASLYNVFCDKRSIYRRLLEMYAAQTLAWCATTLEGDEPREAIRGFFDGLAGTAIDDAQRRGCLVANTGLETAPHDPEFRAAVVSVFDRLENLFQTAVERGQASGSISTAQSSEDLARPLLGAMLGIRVLARTNPDSELLRGMACSAVGGVRAAGRRGSRVI